MHLMSRTSGIDREVQSTPREEVEHVAPDASMSGAVHVEAPCLDLNVSSPVEEVAAAVLEVGQGRSQRSSPTVVVADEPALEAPTNEAEVVVRTEVICLDSDDDVERCVQLDVRVKVKDPAPRRVRGTFADYMTDDSEDEDYGTPGYNRPKRNFIDDPHPLFAARPDTGRNPMGRRRYILPLCGQILGGGSRERAIKFGFSLQVLRLSQDVRLSLHSSVL